MGSKAQGEGLTSNGRRDTSSSETEGIFYSNLIQQTKLCYLNKMSAIEVPLQSLYQILLLFRVRVSKIAI